MAITFICGCSNSSSTREEMDIAERQMQTSPDSALAMLKTLQPQNLSNDADRARYALLISMAIDKNYIDTTTFDVIQPAIDYYIKRGGGNDNDKLRTLYYQGRIFCNRGDEDKAMRTYLKAKDLKENATDTLLVAHLLVAIGVLNNKQYKFADYIADNLEAAKLYQAIGKKLFAAKSYTNALYGFMKLDNKPKADSLMRICKKLAQENQETLPYVQSAIIAYTVENGSTEEITSLLSELNFEDLSEEDAIDIAWGYSRLGKHEEALRLLAEIDLTDNGIDSLKYLATKLMILEKTTRYKEALETYREYDGLNQQTQYKLITNDLLFAQKRHRIEMENMKKLQHRDRMIGAAIIGILALALISVWIYFRLREIRRGKEQTDSDNKRLAEEKSTATLKAETLEKENRRIEAEKEKSEQVCARLREEIGQLREERDSLADALKEKKEMPAPIQDILISRLHMLNGLFAKEITGDRKHAKEYEKHIELIDKDRRKFTASIREAISASYPGFMTHLEKCGLTSEEIDHACLYAIGLKGKEVGDYTGQKNHYNISSRIRSKLGIDEHQTNLSLYITKLMNDGN